MSQKSYGAVARYIAGFVMMNLVLLGLFLYYPGWSSALTGLFAPLTAVESMTILFVLQELVLLGLLWWAMRYRRPTDNFRDYIKHFQQRRQRRGRHPVWTYLFGGLVLYFVCNLFFAFIVYYAGIEIPGMYGEQLAMSMLEQMPLVGRWDYLLIAFIVVILGPIVEEIIYRGFVTDLLMRSLGKRGVVLAAALFAAAHLEWGVIWNLFLLSLFLGYIYYKTESLWYSFLFHVIINGLAIGSLFMARLYPEMVTAFIG